MLPFFAPLHAFASASSAKVVYATAAGACRTHDNGPGTFTVKELTPDACFALCSADETCTGVEIIRPYEPGVAAYLEMYPGGQDMDISSCEIHTATLGYAQSTGILVGEVDMGSRFLCATKAPPTTSGTLLVAEPSAAEQTHALFTPQSIASVGVPLNFFEEAGGAHYGVAVGACRTPQGSGGSWTRLAADPKACKEACLQNRSCVGFEYVSYTEGQKAMARANVAWGEMSVDQPCEIHTERLGYAQAGGINIGEGVDVGPNHVCFAIADPEAKVYNLPNGPQDEFQVGTSASV